MRKARILIVEDEIIIVRGLEDALGKLGYRVCGFALSGEDALSLVEKQKPDLILIDIFLQGHMDGIELAGTVRSHFRIPVIYITAYSDREVLERAKLTDPYGYIVKPFRDSQLKVTVELALERARQEQRKMAEVAEYLSVNEELGRRLLTRTGELTLLAEKHQQMEQEMHLYRRRIDELRNELAEVNRALAVIMRHTDKTRADVELEVAAAIRMKVVPILKQLESDPCLGKFRTDLEMLKLHLYQLSSGLVGESTWSCALSTAELRISTLIQQGCTSEEIAERLHVSLDTVKTHRKRIRRKLNLQNTATNLSTYLLSRSEAAVSG